MFLAQPVPNEDVRVTIATRVPRRLRTRLEARAAQSGHKLSSAAADLLELALDLEQKLEPFRPAIERLKSEDGLSLSQAVAMLLWMDVELDPRPAE